MPRRAKKPYMLCPFKVCRGEQNADCDHEKPYRCLWYDSESMTCAILSDEDLAEWFNDFFQPLTKHINKGTISADDARGILRVVEDLAMKIRRRKQAYIYSSKEVTTC